MPVTAAITAVEGYLPEYVLTNDELAQMVDTNDEWITSRTGVRERRILKGKEQGASVMAIEAVKNLCKKEAFRLKRSTCLLLQLLPEIIYFQQLPILCAIK